MSEIIENEEIIKNIDPTEEPTIEPEPFIIPTIYLFSPETKEYVGNQEAEQDPEASRRAGHFVPLEPAYGTLLEPPIVEENQIQVHSKVIETHQEPYEVIDPETGETHIEYREVQEIIENWEIKADYRKNFYKVDNNLNVFDIDTIGEQEEGYIIISKEIGEDIKANKDWYKITNNKIIKKSNEEYEQDQAAKRKQLFLKDFFNVEGYGYYRKIPKGYQSAVESMNVLLNIAQISNGVQAGLIIFYKEPDFTKAEECTEEWLIQHQIVQPAMTLEQFSLLYVSFMTAWNTQEHQ